MSADDHPAVITTLLIRLRQLLGADHVLTDPSMRAGYEVDWTGRWQGTALAVLRPGSTDEMAAVMRECVGTGVALVTQGGNTGLVGGSVPRPQTPGTPPTLVISTRRLRRLDPVDTAAMQVTVGAGVTLAEWRDHARAAGLDIGVDFASRDSATVGGAIATNAGGSRVVRAGTMRRQVAGLEAVLPNGEVVGSLTGLPKETAGPDLAGVLAGSEGTLAVITAARLRLLPWYRQTVTAMVALTGWPAALGLLAELRAHAPDLDSVEFVLPEALDVVARHLGRVPPVATDGAEVHLLVELAAATDPTDQLMAVLSGAVGVLDTAVAADGAGRSALLEFRDRITESINALGTPLKLDVAVAPHDLEVLIGHAHAVTRRHAGHLVGFGHLPEGNVHLNILDAGTTASAMTEEILGEVARLGGTISAEHGIGVAKSRWLHLIRTPAELEVMAGMRRAWDPDGVMNPGVLSPGS